MISTPPNAEIGSPARASLHASISFSRLAIPHVLLCFSTANVVSLNSPIKLTAASISRRLLYESSFPLSCVNISSRLQELTKQYNCKILISGVTWRILNKENNPFLAREINKLQLRGSSKPITVFEIYNNEEKDIVDYKKNTQNLYNAGLDCYYNRKWIKSIEMFNKCLKINPNDTVVISHLDECNDMITKENLKKELSK